VGDIYLNVPRFQSLDIKHEIQITGDMGDIDPDRLRVEKNFFFEERQKDLFSVYRTRRMSPMSPYVPMCL
jgi:hypothetical protein